MVSRWNAVRHLAAEPLAGQPAKAIIHGPGGILLPGLVRQLLPGLVR